MNQRAAFILYLLALITYGQDVKPLLDKHCVECHSSGNKLNLSHFPFLSTTVPDQPTIVGRMLSKVGSNPPQMPPGNRPKLTQSEVRVLQQWRDAGLAP